MSARSVCRHPSLESGEDRAEMSDPGGGNKRVRTARAVKLETGHTVGRRLDFVGQFQPLLATGSGTAGPPSKAERPFALLEVIK
jgi:hypothetical protein